MPNPTPDYPESTYTPPDLSAFAGQKLGGTSPKQTEVVGQIAEELKAMQLRLGLIQTAISGLPAGKILTTLGSGEADWQDPVVTDEAMTIDTVRLCDWSFGAFDSSIWNLGTGGSAKIKHRRVGRLVDGWIKVTIASDYTVPGGFFIILHPDDFPHTPKVEGAAGVIMPGGFGALYRQDTNGSPPYNGYRHGLSPVVQDIGTGQSLMVFFRTESEAAIPAAAENLFSPISGTPEPAANLGGASFLAYFIYEAASAA